MGGGGGEGSMTTYFLEHIRFLGIYSTLVMSQSNTDGDDGFRRQVVGRWGG